MKIEKGEIIIGIDEMIRSVSVEDKKRLVKELVLSNQLINWVLDFICGEDEDGFWSSDCHEFREKFLCRVEESQVLNVNVGNWSLINEATQRLKEIKSEQHVYWSLYHLPRECKDITIAEYVRTYLKGENQFFTDKAEKEIAQVIQIVKDAVSYSDKA